MADWITKLHGFLTLNDREILPDAGKVSHKDAEKHALTEYEKFRSAEAKRLDVSEDELETAMKRLRYKKRSIAAKTPTTKSRSLLLEAIG